jgi:PKHD-type hydroxylase
MDNIYNINVQDLKSEISLNKIKKDGNIINSYNNHFQEHNNVQQHPNIIGSSTVFKEPLNSKIIQLLIDEINENQENFEIAKIGSDEEMDPYSLKNIRNSFVYFLPSTHWVHGIVWDYILKANSEIWNYNIEGIQSLQLTKYGPNQFYNWHVDFNPDKNHPDYLRKLSLTIQLNDPSEYDGGVLEIFDYHGKKISTQRNKGCVCVFESRTRHRVTKVKSGVRYSLVAWIVGPPLI